jgi:subtilisin family serine protease
MPIGPEKQAHPSGENLRVDPTRVVLGFATERSREEIARRLVDLNLVLEDDDEDVEGRQFFERINHSPERFWIRSRDGAPIDEQAVEALYGLDVEWIAPVYRSRQVEGRKGFLTFLPHVILLETDEEGDLPVAEKYGLREVPEKSEHLVGYRYFVVGDVRSHPAYDIRQEILESGETEVRGVELETVPLIIPTALIPSDVHFNLQWDMTRIRAGGPGVTAWDMSQGSNMVVICVLDEGCDLGHPDLQYSSSGINLGTMGGTGAPTGNHGTACAGIAAARINGIGVAGVAGGCRVLPVAFSTWSDVEVAAGINYATANGARVISMSFGWDPWNHAIIDPAIQNAFNSNVVMCVATHNYNGAITYPATNPLVLACGASDQADERKSPGSPDGECWGSNFGPRMSVVAPGVRIPTTDIQGAAGYNNNNGGPKPGPCVNYAVGGDAAGDYDFIFNGTSAATPHVAGLAALLISYRPTLTNVRVRNIIERTAAKVGSVPYVQTPAHPNGRWNQEMGYGRINARRALRRLVERDDDDDDDDDDGS